MAALLSQPAHHHHARLLSRQFTGAINQSNLLDNSHASSKIRIIATHRLNQSVNLSCILFVISQPSLCQAYSKVRINAISQFISQPNMIRLIKLFKSSIKVCITAISPRNQSINPTILDYKLNFDLKNCHWQSIVNFDSTLDQNTRFQFHVDLYRYQFASSFSVYYFFITLVCGQIFLYLTQ